jgi:hypothetical protein
MTRDEFRLEELRAKVNAGAMLSRAECTQLLDALEKATTALEEIGEGACGAKYGPGCDGLCKRVAYEALREPVVG